MSGAPSAVPRAVERPLTGGSVVRGLQWGDAPDRVLLLHEPGTDIDAWGWLPANIAGQLPLEVLALDLPGHGLSDEPWEPARLPDLPRELLSSRSPGRPVLIAAGPSGLASLECAAELGLTGLVCLSPNAQFPESSLGRSPSTPKLFFAGSLADDDLVVARRLAARAGGWSRVTSVPVNARGTGLLATKWGDCIIEQIVEFLHDCQNPPATGREVLRTRPG